MSHPDITIVITVDSTNPPPPPPPLASPKQTFHRCEMCHPSYITQSPDDGRCKWFASIDHVMQVRRRRWYSALVFVSLQLRILRINNFIAFLVIDTMAYKNNGDLSIRESLLNVDSPLYLGGTSASMTNPLPDITVRCSSRCTSTSLLCAGVIPCDEKSVGLQFLLGQARRSRRPHGVMYVSS